MPIFEDQTPELIRSRILERMNTELQTREGSFAYDLVSPVSFELWRVLMTLDELIDAFYVTQYSGPYLDNHANLLGMVRRAGTKATAAITFTGRSGVTIPAGTSFFTASGLEFLLVDDVTLEDETGTGELIAAQMGGQYNVDAGEIDQILRNISGLTGYSNEAASGGADPESDAALYERIDARRKNPATSGNEAHYIEWALECDGVGAAKATGLWNGPGTVRVLVVDYDRKPMDAALVESVAAYIQTKRPVGADVTVVSAVAAEIDVSAAVTFDASTTAEAIRAAYVSKLDTYLQELADEYFKDNEVYAYTLRYNKVASLLMEIDGVIDFTSLTINGGTENIEIDALSVPELGEVEVS